ncbi:transcriptional regulator [Microbacterium aurum]|uniref:Transcriptional regulator n=2 Tax=Microbacterium aurum TaxID=36805 RepID=A0A1P8U5K1_9MICO|nr:transcriptional regulator [Microbacterium aurum]
MAWQPADELAQAVALEVLLHGPLGRSELARRLSLAPATLTRISTELIRAGLLVEAPHAATRGTGRPSIPLDVIPEAHYFLGIKLSGDALMSTITNLRADVLSYREIPLSSRDADYIVAQIAVLVQEARAEHAIDAVGICLGGVVTEDGTVNSAPFLDWRDVPLARLVEERSGLPVFASNDLAAFTEAQHWFGLGTGHANFATLTLGVGVGFGCVANGRLLANSDSGVGLVGHWPLDPLGPPCSRGHRGCAEAMLTIPAIERDVSTAIGRPARWSEIIELATLGDPAASRILASSGRALGRLIAAVANLTAPELVVLGGEGVDIAWTAVDAVQEGIEEQRDPRASKVRVELASGGNETWCRGAAVVAIQGYVLAAKQRSVN